MLLRNGIDSFFEATQTLAFALALAVVCTLVVSLVFVPAMIITFPRFFYTAHKGCGRQKVQEDKYARLTHRLENGDEDGVQSFGSKTDRNKLGNKCGDRFAKGIVKFPCNLAATVAIVACAIPVAIKASQMEMTARMTQSMPRSLPEAEAYRRMIDQFGQGVIAPVDILFKAPQSLLDTPGIDNLGPVINQSFFASVQQEIRLWEQKLPIAPQDTFAGIVHAPGFDPLAEEIAMCLKPGSMLYPLAICKAARFNYGDLVAPDGKATMVTFTARSFDPTDPRGKLWLDTIRPMIANFTARTGIQVDVAGGPIDILDIIHLVYSKFPLMAGVTGTVVFVLTALAFRSLILPILSVLTVSLTIAFVYGAAVAVYMDGALDWMHIVQLSKQGALYWVPPICTIVILLGLTLDFTIFLLVHVVEARRFGLSTADSISLALRRTLHIITAAGMIMAVAFSGLLMSGIFVLNLFGFYMVATVLVDTFVVRALLLPALMSMVGDAIWWPMPKWSSPESGRTNSAK